MPGKTRCWVAAHMCVLSHLRTCDVHAEVRKVFERAIALLLTVLNKMTIFPVLERPFPVLECTFLF